MEKTYQDLFGRTIPEKCYIVYGHFDKDNNEYILRNSLNFQEFLCSKEINISPIDFIDNVIERFNEPVKFKKDRLDNYFDENEKKAYNMIQEFLEYAYGKEKVYEIGRLRYWRDFHGFLEQKIFDIKHGKSDNKESSSEGKTPEDCFEEFYRNNYSNKDYEGILEGLKKGIEKINVRTEEWEKYHKSAEDAIQLLSDYIIQRYHLPGFRILNPNEIWRDYLERADTYSEDEHLYNISKIIYRRNTKFEHKEITFHNIFEQLKIELFPYFFMLDNFGSASSLCTNFFEMLDDETCIEEFEFKSTLEETITNLDSGEIDTLKQGSHILLCSILGLDVFEDDIMKAFHTIYRTCYKTVRNIFDGIVDGKEVALEKLYNKGVSRLYSFAHQKTDNL